MNTVNIEGFKLLEKLGEGGMGAVYKARQLSLDRLVAIKILPRHIARDQNIIEQFLTEAKVAASLKHNNIIQIYQAGRSKNDFYFIMELISGYTVESWVERKGRLSEEDSLIVAGYVADALSYAWDQAHIIHGDVKPSNIMVDSDGTIKLADFLALTPPEGASLPEVLKENVMGTPNYMSPEQACGKKDLDFCTDVYSLGAILYHMITGVLPFSEEQEPHPIMRKQMTDFLQDPSEKQPETSMAVAWLIEKMMVKDRAHRYQSWEEVKEDIHRVKTGSFPSLPFPHKGTSTIARTEKRARTAIPSPPAVPPPTKPSLSENKKFRLPLWIIILPLILLLGGVALVRELLFHNKPATPPASEHVNMELLEPSSPSPNETALQPAPQIVTQTPPSPPTADEIKQPEPLPSPEDDDPPQEKELVIQSEDLEAFTRIREGFFKLLHQRKYEPAQQFMEHWLQAHPEHPYTQEALLDIERSKDIQNLFSLLEAEKLQLIGTTVHAEPSISGELSNIKDGMVTITRRTPPAGRVMLTVGLHKIHKNDMPNLLQLAAPHQASQYIAIWYLSQADFPQAQHHLQDIVNNTEETEKLRQWLQNWQKTAANIQAYALLGAIEQALKHQQLSLAEQLLKRMKDRVILSDVVSWAKKERIAQIEEDLLNYRLQENREEETSQEGQDRLEEDLPSEPTPASSPKNIQREIEEFEIIDLKERAWNLDKQVVRVRFRFRGDIIPVRKNTYAVELGSEYGNVQTSFSEEAFSWIKKTPRWNHKSKRKKVYGIVDAAAKKLRLIGRKRTRGYGNTPDTFSW